MCISRANGQCFSNRRKMAYVIWRIVMKKYSRVRLGLNGPRVCKVIQEFRQQLSEFPFSCAVLNNKLVLHSFFSLICILFAIIVLKYLIVNRESDTLENNLTHCLKNKYCQVVSEEGKNKNVKHSFLSISLIWLINVYNTRQWAII